MLVLTRKKSESVVIHVNGTIVAEIMVVQSTEGRVRLGFAAAEAIGVDRAEVFEERHPNALAHHKKQPK